MKDYGEMVQVSLNTTKPSGPSESLLQSSDALVKRLLAIEDRTANIVARIFGAKLEAEDAQVGISEASSLAADLRVSHRTVGRIEELITQLQDGL